MAVHRSILLILALAVSAALDGCGDSRKQAAAEAEAPRVATVGPVAEVSAPPPPPTPRGDAPAAVVDFVRIPIVDTGFGAPVNAFFAEIPADWQSRGGVVWNRSTPCLANQMRVEWGASAPDGRRGVEILPGFSWQVAGWQVALNPCPVAPIESAQGYLQGLVASLYPGATVVDYRDRPDVVAESEATASPPMQGIRSLKQAGEIAIRYPISDRIVHETLAAMVTFTEASVPGMRPSRMGLVSGVYVVRAVEGEDMAETGERIRKSLKADPAWAEQIGAYGRETAARMGAEQRAQIDQWHARRMAEISAKGAADRAAIRAQTTREIGEINAAGWKSRQDSLDRMHRDRVDTIREVNRYQDPVAGRQVELSSHYAYGYRTGSGQYVATDDPNFDPGANGQQMQQVR